MFVVIVYKLCLFKLIVTSCLIVNIGASVGLLSSEKESPMPAASQTFVICVCLCMFMHVYVCLFSLLFLCVYWLFVY